MIDKRFAELDYYHRLLFTAKDVFWKLEKCQFFLKIGLSKNCWQMPVVEEDIRKTAFVKKYGCDEFLRTPFCLKNSGAALVCWLRKLLEKLDHVKSYTDDLIVFTNTETLI